MTRAACLAAALALAACAGSRGDARDLPSCTAPEVSGLSPVALPSRSATQLLASGVDDLQRRVRFPRRSRRTMPDGAVVQIVASFVVDETGRVVCTDAQGTGDASFLRAVRRAVAETAYVPYTPGGVPTPFSSAVSVIYRMTDIDLTEG